MANEIHTSYATRASDSTYFVDIARVKKLIHTYIDTYVLLDDLATLAEPGDTYIALDDIATLAEPNNTYIHTYIHRYIFRYNI